MCSARHASSTFKRIKKNSFGGLIVKRCFHYGIVQRPNFNPDRIPDQLKEAAERLRRVQLEHLPYQDVVARYDRPTTLFYLDPPYYNIRLHRHNLERSDFEQMAELLGRIEGKFLLSLNDHPDVREIFNAFQIRPLN